MQVIDLRSDTVTKPSAAMRAFMMEAEVGDDGYGEDPTVAALERRVAELTGFEAGLFVASGTMGNQVALRTLTQPGDPIIVAARAHLLQFEMGASAKNASVQLLTVDDRLGYPDPSQVADLVRQYRRLHNPIRLIALENTHMPSGGIPIDQVALETILEAADGTPVYVDGARLWNAAVALDVTPALLCRGVVAVSTCLSKGLAAPMGSVLSGSAEFIGRARLERARLGGRLRQAGIMAAGGLYALAHHMNRLEEDHRRAQRLASIISTQLPATTADVLPVRTNIVMVRVKDPAESARRLAEEGVLCNVLPAGDLRLVTHRDLDDAAIDLAANRIVASL
ncbi:GntG family PLP-dependent aldolase [Ferrimicrobium sp.]|uniref:threonine aldolase family protein n=1 Tax=Ferrimicrobium sp. TaxID=2926050 RepID=UPI002611C331|nr:GntG family PLP-dependent aldolase [Ferrimicrobium sp.]